MRVLALGSCRIHHPLKAARPRSEIEYLNRLFWVWPPLFVHDVHEAIQLVRLGRGELAMPKEIRPFAFENAMRWRRRIPLPLRRVEYVVVEICTDKHYEAAGWTLNVNEIHRHLRERTGAAGEEWWLAIERGQRPSEALVQGVEAELRARWRTRWRFGEGHRLVLRELAFRYLSVAEIAEGMACLKALVARPLLVVPHVAVRLADGSLLAERLQHIEKTVEAARSLGLPVLDPRSFVGRDGQSRALGKGGTDFNHYAPDYLPVVGREIVEALRDCSDGKFNPVSRQPAVGSERISTSGD
ncbi:MAG: hypothetical protein Q8L22_29540 [Reyranella sp.]|nr:hypothetical protein [Reyranella sp.]